MTTTTSTNRIYPGLLCNSIEFFVTGKRLKIISGGQVKDINDATYCQQQVLKEAIEKQPAVKEMLHSWYPHSKMKRIIQYGSCRFGGLDYQPDYQNSHLQDGEYSFCAARGMCPGEGILCKAPKFRGTELTFQEINLLQLLAGRDTNDVIAEKMEMPFGSLHPFKRKLYQKLNIQTKQEAAMVVRDLNLL